MATRAAEPATFLSAIDRPVFSPLELAVIGIGNRDPMIRFARRDRLASLWRLLFGIKAPLPFADRRLEALRVLTLALRRRDRSPEAEVAIALRAGVAPRQIEHLRSGG